MAARRSPAAIAEAGAAKSAIPKIEPVEGVLYESIRIVGEVHKLRFGVSAKLVQAGDGQTITYRDKPFQQFKVMPSGVEIPLANVTSAIPKDAALVQKLTRKSRLEARKEQLDAVLQQKEAESPGGVVIQDVPDDGYVDPSTDDEGGDGIDV